MTLLQLPMTSVASTSQGEHKTLSCSTLLAGAQNRHRSSCMVGQAPDLARQADLDAFRNEPLVDVWGLHMQKWMSAQTHLLESSRCWKYTDHRKCSPRGREILPGSILKLLRVLAELVRRKRIHSGIILNLKGTTPIASAVPSSSLTPSQTKRGQVQLARCC